MYRVLNFKEVFMSKREEILFLKLIYQAMKEQGSVDASTSPEEDDALLTKLYASMTPSERVVVTSIVEIAKQGPSNPDRVDEIREILERHGLPLTS
jgi:hypothetical protein